MTSRPTFSPPSPITGRFLDEHHHLPQFLELSDISDFSGATVAHRTASRCSLISVVPMNPLPQHCAVLEAIVAGSAVAGGVVTTSVNVTVLYWRFKVSRNRNDHGSLPQRCNGSILHRINVNIQARLTLRTQIIDMSPQR